VAATELENSEDIGVLLVWADLDGGDCGWKGRKGIPHRRGEWGEVGDTLYVGAQSEKVLHRVVHPIMPLRWKVARQRDAPHQFAEARCDIQGIEKRNETDRVSNDDTEVEEANYTL
jgi:hypothetical protein